MRRMTPRISGFFKPTKRFTVWAVAGVLAVSISLTQQPAPAKAAATTWQLPCPGYSNPYYGFGQFVSGWGYHVAQDVCNDAGTPVFAAAEGRVVYSARTPNSYRWGNLVIVEHRNADGSAVVTIYGHLGDNRAVGVGQSVAKGQLLGYVGPDYSDQNGNWGAHLHFGIKAGVYGAAAGTYATWVRGYENSFPAGWLNPSEYVNGRLSNYDYVVGGADPATLSYLGEQTVSFSVINTGAQTWRKDGATPTRLGSIFPRDRGSVFSQGGAGWAGTNRIKMEADTPPQGVARFSATFKSNQVPGRYNECFSVLVEGVTWMHERPLCSVIDVLPPNYRAQYAGQQISTEHDPTNLGGITDASYLLPGQKRNFKLKLKNVGELPWDVDGATPVRLGTSNPRDRGSIFTTLNDSSINASSNWLGHARASGIDGRYDPGTNTVVADNQITTGETALFSFTITAPNAPGVYREYFNPVVEGRTWMADMGIWFPIRVMGGGYQYEYVSQGAVPQIGTTTKEFSTTLQLRNIGSVSWPVNGAFRLGTDQPRDHSSPFYAAPTGGADAAGWQAPSRLSAIDRNVTTSGKSTVDPGEIAEFSMRFNVPPLNPGQYRTYVKPVMEGVAWLPGEYGIYYPINITAAPYNYQVVRQDYSTNHTSAPVGSQVTATWAIKNTGRAAWPTAGNTPVRLATSRPQDRSSWFANLNSAQADSWLAPSRASAIKGRVTDLASLTTVAAAEIQPGETALFRTTFNIPVGTNPYTYYEYFNLVREGVTWLPDYGIYVPLTTTP